MARKTRLECEITEPLNMAGFAKYIGVPEDDVYDLPFDGLCQLLKKHGFWLTGDGILPKPGGYPKEKR